MHIQRHAVLVGIGKVGIQVFNALPTQWSITVIDKDLKQLNKIPDIWGGKPVTKLCADGTSRLVLQEANLVQTSVLAVLTQDDEVNAEVVRIAKEHFLVPRGNETRALQRENALRLGERENHGLFVGSHDGRSGQRD